jgi:hypothetical protein
MTSVQRSYINLKFNQEVDDGCLEYKSIPMAVVSDLVKISHATNEYTGIKQVYNLIPPRPKDINTMATSIARINNLSYNSVAGISKQFIGEEVSGVRNFVANAPAEPVEFQFSQSYIPEQPVRSSSGARLVPTTTREMIDNPKYQRSEAVSLILGDLAPTSGVVPFRTDQYAQTEWVNSKEEGFSKRDIMFGYTKASAEYQGGGIGYADERNTYYREGMGTQTELTKPPSGKYIERGMLGEKQRFFENSEDRFGTVTGTPTRQLALNDKIERGISMLGPHHTLKRDFQGEALQLE